MAKITTATGSDADLTLEPDGTGDINLTPGTNGDVNIPANKGITFGNDGEKIEGNATKLDIAAAEIDFSIEAGGDINIGTDIGLTFGAAGEKIEGDGTDLTVSSSGNFTVDATGDIILDAGGADVTLKDGGTTFGSLKQASGHLVLQPTSSKEIILNDQGGTAALTVDIANQHVSINNGNLVIGSAGQGIDFSGAQTSATEATTGTTGSEILNSYEDGTWTPTHGTFTFSTATGHYTKIGNLVTFSGYIVISNATTSNGAFGGLPFAEGKGGFECGGSVTWDGLNISGTTLYVRVNNSAQTWTFYGSVDDGGVNNTLTSVDGDSIAFCGHYYT
jgi:hypothetical protein